VALHERDHPVCVRVSGPGPIRWWRHAIPLLREPLPAWVRGDLHLGHHRWSRKAWCTRTTSWWRPTPRRRETRGQRGQRDAHGLDVRAPHRVPVRCAAVHL